MTTRARKIADVLHSTSNTVGIDTDTQAELRFDLGASNLNNTAPADKPISSAQQTALNGKANLSGFTLTGPLTIPDGNSDLAAVTKKQLDGKLTGPIESISLYAPSEALTNTAAQRVVAQAKVSNHFYVTRIVFSGQASRTIGVLIDSRLDFTGSDWEEVKDNGSEWLATSSSGNIELNQEVIVPKGSTISIGLLAGDPDSGTGQVHLIGYYKDTLPEYTPAPALNKVWDHFFDSYGAGNNSWTSPDAITFAGSASNAYNAYALSPFTMLSTKGPAVPGGGTTLTYIERSFPDTEACVAIIASSQPGYNDDYPNRTSKLSVELNGVKGRMIKVGNRSDLPPNDANFPWRRTPVIAFVFPKGIYNHIRISYSTFTHNLLGPIADCWYRVLVCDVKTSIMYEPTLTTWEA